MVADASCPAPVGGERRFVGPTGLVPEATELAAVASSGAFRLDARALAARAWSLPPSVPGETPYVGIRWVSSDHLAELPALSAPPPSRSAAPVLLREALEAAVERALAGARRVAVLTGGGVDSSVLLALAVRWARKSSGSVFGVALDFEADGDDRPHLRAVASYLDCPILRVRPEDAAARIAHVREGIDAAPFTWPTGPCEIEMLVRARREGADCVLTGAGGDELFNGEPSALATLARRRPFRAMMEARRLAGFSRPASPVFAWILRPLVSELVPPSLRDRRRRGGPRPAPAWAGPTLRAVSRDQIEAAARASSAPRLSAEERFRAFVSEPHREHVMWLGHQEQVASGVRCRDPYFDLELIRAVMSLPREWLLAGSRRRGLLRDAMRGHLPESARERLDKSSFEPALERFTAAAGGLRQLLPYASGEHLAELGIVEPKSFAAAAESFLARPAAEDWVSIWPALACEAFLRARARGAAS